MTCERCSKTMTLSDAINVALPYSWDRWRSGTYITLCAECIAAYVKDMGLGYNCDSCEDTLFGSTGALCESCVDERVSERDSYCDACGDEGTVLCADCRACDQCGEDRGALCVDCGACANCAASGSDAELRCIDCREPAADSEAPVGDEQITVSHGEVAVGDDLLIVFK